MIGYGGVTGTRVAVAGTGVLALPGLLTEKGLSPGGQTKTKSAGLAGLDSEAVRRWVAEAARSVRQITPPVIVPSTSQLHLFHHQHQQAQQLHQNNRRTSLEATPSTVGAAFALPTSMTQTPSMHLLENNNLEVAMAQQQQQNSQPSPQPNQNPSQAQKQKQTGSPTNNNTIDAWRSIQGGHQWWSPPSSVHQDQEMAQVTQAPSIISATLSQQRLQQPAQSDGDQPLDFSVGSLQQQRLHARVRTMHERLQSRIHHNNNNGTGGSGLKAGRIERRSYSPSETSTSGSEDEGVSTGGSPSGPLRGAETGEYHKFWKIF